MTKIDAHAHVGEWYMINESGTAAELVRLGARHGIAKTIASHVLSLLVDIREGNRLMAGAAEAHDSLYGYIGFNPDDVGASLAEIERYADHPKMIGVKVRSEFHGWPIDSRPCREILKLAEKLDLPLLYHSGSPSGAARVSDELGVSIILAHMGGADWRGAVEAVSGAERVWLEPCGSIMDYDKIGFAVERLGPERIVFGSDSTLIDPAWTIGKIEGADISDEDRRKIYYENAVRIFSHQVDLSL